MEAANISDIFDTNVLSPTHIQILTEFGSKWNIEELWQTVKTSIYHSSGLS